MDANSPWWHALYMVVMAVTMAVLNWMQRRQVRKDTRQTVRRTVRPVKKELKASLNGDGLGGRLKSVEDRMAALEAKVDEIPKKAAEAAIAAFNPRPDGDAKPPAGG